MKNLFSNLKKYRYRYLLIGLLLLVVSSPLIVRALKPAAPTEAEQTVKVTKGNVAVSFSVDGQTILDQRDLSFEIAGIVRDVLVDEGDEVKPYQTIAYLDTREAQKNLELKMRDYLSTRNDFDEMSEVTYPDATIVDDTIRRILEKNQWNLESSVLDVELKDLALKQSYLSSPIEGIVASLSLQPGELASTSKVAATIVKPDSLVVEAYLEDIEALKVKDEMLVRIIFEALPDDEFLGHITYLSPLATTDENGLSTYRLVVTLDETGQTLLDGMAGELEIISKEVEGVLKLPNSAIKREDGQSLVYSRDENGNLASHVVELGFTNGKEVEIKSGLELGNSVINWK
jgi:membrane fusion protein (multidrug efflux system)